MSYFICGTDTNVGKTLTSALLMRELHEKGKNFHYWKPVQTGSDDDDSATVQKLSGVSQEYFLPKHCHFKEPLSPHRAAELEGTEISLSAVLSDLKRYQKGRKLIVEGAGGLLVPLNRRETWLDFLQESDLPVVVVARSGLGTINHSLLTLHRLSEAEIPVAGILFFGPRNSDNLRTVCAFSKVPCLGAFDFIEDNTRQEFAIWQELDLQPFLESPNS